MFINSSGNLRLDGKFPSNPFVIDRVAEKSEREMQAWIAAQLRQAFETIREARYV